MLNESDAIFIDGRWYLKADALPASIQELAVSEKVEFRFVDGKTYLDAVLMIEATRNDNRKIENETKEIKQYLKHNHPFRYVWMKISTGASWLFGFDV